MKKSCFLFVQLNFLIVNNVLEKFRVHHRKRRILNYKNMFSHFFPTRIAFVIEPQRTICAEWHSGPKRVNDTHPIQICRAVLKYLWNLMTNHFVQRSRPSTIQNLPLQGILKRLSQFCSSNRWKYKTHFFYFLLFTFLLITNEPW